MLETFFFFFSKDVSMKNGILRERGEGGEKNFILKSEFMFPEESNPFSIVSLFLPRSKLITKGSIKIQIIRKYFWIDILFSISQFKPVTLINRTPLPYFSLNNSYITHGREIFKQQTSAFWKSYDQKKNQCPANEILRKNQNFSREKYGENNRAMK